MVSARQAAQSPFHALDPRRTALLLFDLLNGHVKTDDGAIRERWRPVIAVCVALLRAARVARLPVMYACAAHRADHATSAHTLRDADNRLRPLAPDDVAGGRPIIAGGTWQAQVIDELAPEAADDVIPKYRWSAFHQTYLDLALRTRGIDTLVLAGGSTDVGVTSTAFAARDLDYHLVIVSDGCTSPEQDNHDQLMRRVFPRMARVRTASEVSAMLEAGSR